MTSPPRSLTLVALALAVVVVVGHARVLLGGKTWDDVRYHAEVAPPRLAAADAIQHGALPAWWEGTALGVPLAAEPSHGALYPPLWLAATPGLLDLVMLLHLAWAALGVAVWARGRTSGAHGTASDHGALIAGALIATTGILASAAVRGALPALAHLPWIAIAAGALAAAADPRARARATVALALLIGLVALAGVLAVVVDALVLAAALGARRRVAGYLAIAVAAGLAVGCVQWVPAVLQLGHGAGADAPSALPLGRILELIVPGSFGATDPDRAIGALAGASPWAPSLFVGAPLLALAAVRTPPMRVLVALAVFAVLALLVGRGTWPAWLGAPEVQVAAFALVLAPHAGAGLDALAGGQRRAVLAFAAGAACVAIALGALVVLRGQQREAAPAITRVLLDGGLGLACMVAVLVLVWRTPGRALPLMLALIVLPGIGAMPAVAPTIERAVVTEPPPFVTALDDAPRPLRVFRPAFLHEDPDTLADAIGTFAGGSAWRWGVTGARSVDPARPVDHDRTWLAASNEGGALLDRFGIAAAILPETMVGRGGMTALARRGTWALVPLPVAPLASVVRGWRWAIAAEDAFALMFPSGGGTSVLRSTVVLKGSGPAGPPGGASPEPCTIEAWRPGDIALRCRADAAGYAVVSSTTSPGWRVTVDGAPATWWTADVLRRAVAIPQGEHRVHWRYTTPGLALGVALAGAGVFALAVLSLIAGRRPQRAREAGTN